MSGHWQGRGRGRGLEHRGKGRGRIAPGLRPVHESTRISIRDQLETFQKSDETELTFSAGYSNDDRAVVHAEALKFGFKSKSTGKGTSRAVSVFKQHRTVSDVESSPVIFSPSSAALIRRHLQRFPTSEAESGQATSSSPGAQSSRLPKIHAANLQAEPRQKKQKRTLHGSADFSQEEVLKRRKIWQDRQGYSSMSALKAIRSSLPIASMRTKILEAIRQHQVILIAGETGCGKTTQVPQFVLEDCWEQGKGCRVMCTQPRRISAITIAERVAAERGERVGDNVGYSIRLESSGGPSSSLMFCTNGVLLRMLTQGEELEGVTHVVVDEVHERDRFAEFMLILMRELLTRHPTIKLVLMSATLHVELFSAYFANCPVIHVPGFTHPVTDVYLDDILPLIGYTVAGSFKEQSAGSMNHRRPQLGAEEQGKVDEAIMHAFLNASGDSFDELLQTLGVSEGGDSDLPMVNACHTKTGATGLMVAASKGNLEMVTQLLSLGADPQQKAADSSTAKDWADRFGHTQIAEFLGEHLTAVEEAEAATSRALQLSRYQATTDAEEVDLHLIESLLLFICNEQQQGKATSDKATIQGAILVFLPGWDEIARLKDQLEAHRVFGTARYSILALHSMVPAADQRRVFSRPPAHVRKVVLATNIAETAVTIDDIVCVINSGRMKEKSYDPYTAVSTLMSTWISKASEKQRRGRAGRCQPGVCFHLYTQQRSQALQDFQAAELQRTPLDELCLQVKLLEGKGFGSLLLKDFLSKAVEPPPLPSIKNAVQLLEEIGALTPKTEKLTLLGRHLAGLPLPPRVSKMLLYGILFDVLDPLLTIACCIAYRSPWMLPMDIRARQKADEAKQRFAASGGQHSDHLAIVEAYRHWAASQLEGRDRQFAGSHFLNGATMKMVQGMRKQLSSELQAKGFIRSIEDASRNAPHTGLVRAVLGAAFYPQFGQLLPPLKGQKGVKLLTASQEKVKVHASSLNNSFQQPHAQNGTSCSCLAFDEKTRSESMLFAMQTTAVSPQVLLLVAHQLVHRAEVDGDEAEVEEEGLTRMLVDGWMCLSLEADILPSLMVLRARLAECFATRVSNPKGRLSAQQADLIDMLSAVFMAEGHSCGLDRSPGRLAPQQQTPAPQIRREYHPQEGQYSSHYWQPSRPAAQFSKEMKTLKLDPALPPGLGTHQSTHRDLGRQRHGQGNFSHRDRRQFGMSEYALSNPS